MALNLIQSNMLEKVFFFQDVLEFVDCGCNGFLSNMCLVIASYNDMFLNKQDK